LKPLERQFLLRSGEFIGAFKHVVQQDRDTLKIELIGDEALKTSAIEGEVLNRDSVQSSLRQRARKAHYSALEGNNKDTEITDWLTYFAETILEAQTNTMKRLEFYLAKAKLYEKLRGQLNERQDKVIARMFREGIDGFKGGLSAENYISITKSSRAAATRDLQDVVSKGALTKTGELRHTRYHLKHKG
jgi:Fic family protein